MDKIDKKYLNLNCIRFKVFLYPTGWPKKNGHTHTHHMAANNRSDQQQKMSCFIHSFQIAPPTVDRTLCQEH